MDNITKNVHGFGVSPWLDKTHLRSWIPEAQPNHGSTSYKIPRENNWRPDTKNQNVFISTNTRDSTSTNATYSVLQ